MTDGFIVTNGEGAIPVLNPIGNDLEAAHVLDTAKEVAEAVHYVPSAQVYALVPIPAELVAHYIEARTNHGLTRAGFLHDLALRFMGVLEWPDGSGADPEETAQSLAELDGDTWRE